MSTDPMSLLQEYAAGKTKAGKQSFLDAVQEYAHRLEYAAFLEKGAFGCQNLLIGDPRQAKFFLTCGSACSGVAAWLEILRTFPENQRSKVCFVFLDGKIGAHSFAGKYQSDRQLVFHLDHIGDGTHLRMFPTKSLARDRIRLTSLYRACGYLASRDLLVEEKKIPFSVKIRRVFPWEVTICALQDHKKGMRYNRKTKTSAFDETNVNILRAALTTFLCCDEVN